LPEARRVGFTGSRYLNPTHHLALDEVLFAYLGAEEYTTGGAVGVDTYVLRRLKILAPEALHRVCLPEHGPDWDNEYLKLADEVIRVPDTMNHAHRSRNKAIIAHSDVMLAFPLHPESHDQSKRSGTWMTIRMAQKAGVKVDITVLEP
jgi:hypothetical protein